MVRTPHEIRHRSPVEVNLSIERCTLLLDGRKLSTESSHAGLTLLLLLLFLVQNCIRLGL